VFNHWLRLHAAGKDVHSGREGWPPRATRSTIWTDSGCAVNATVVLDYFGVAQFAETGAFDA